MTKIRKVGIVLTAVAIAITASLFALTAHANPLFFFPVTQSAAATSTLTILANGASATSTAVDSYGIPGQPLALNKGTLLIQDTASSTSSVLNIAFQYSNDNLDWYSDDLTSQTATTTGAINVSAANSFNWTAAGTVTALKSLTVSFPTRYVRAIFTESGAAAGIWWEFVPQRESN